jgi:putative ABC transport system permease protein
MRNLLLAFRNVLRHKRKTFAVLVALIIGLAGLVVFQGFVSDLMREWRDESILSGIGHLQVAGKPGYFDDGEFNPYDYPFPQSAKVASQLEREPGVRAVFPSTGFVAIAGFGDESTNLLVKGYPTDRMFFAAQTGLVKPPPDRFFLGTLQAGNPIRPGDHNVLILGQTIARILKASVGDTVTLMTILPGSQLTGRDFVIGGIFTAPQQDNLFGYTDYDTAVDFTQLAQAPVLDVLLDGVGRVDTVAASLPAGVSFRTWKDLATTFAQVNSLLYSILSVIRVVILLVTLFILANVMNRVVVERMREWGTLRALGTKKRGILAIVVWEGGLMGALGAALGIVLGFAIATAINLRGGLTFNQGAQITQIFVHPGLDSVLVNIIPAALVGGLAALFPALRAIRLSPTECLREV